MNNGTFLIEMGNKIRRARKANNMTLQVLSDLAEIDLANLSMLERGMRNIHILSLKTIADVLNLDVKDFL